MSGIEEASFIKVAKTVFRYDAVLTTWGWPHEVYYDVKSKVYIIHAFPAVGTQYEMTSLPEDGLGEIEVAGTVYKVRVFDS